MAIKRKSSFRKGEIVTFKKPVVESGSGHLRRQIIFFGWRKTKSGVRMHGDFGFETKMFNSKQSLLNAIDWVFMSRRMK